MNCSYIVLKEPVWPVGLLGGGVWSVPIWAPPLGPEGHPPRGVKPFTLAARARTTDRRNFILTRVGVVPT